MTAIDPGRPVSGDVVDLNLADHRRFEELRRDLRDSTSDRDAVPPAFGERDLMPEWATAPAGRASETAAATSAARERRVVMGSFIGSGRSGDGR